MSRQFFASSFPPVLLAGSISRFLGLRPNRHWGSVVDGPQPSDLRYRRVSGALARRSCAGTPRPMGNEEVVEAELKARMDKSNSMAKTSLYKCTRYIDPTTRPRSKIITTSYRAKSLLYLFAFTSTRTCFQILSQNKYDNVIVTSQIRSLQFHESTSPSSSLGLTNTSQKHLSSKIMSELRKHKDLRIISLFYFSWQFFLPTKKGV